MASTSFMGISIDGDINVGRGQLGKTQFITIGTDITLWTDTERVNKYLINPSSNINVKLLVIGSGVNQIQSGSNLYLFHNGTSNTLTIKDSSNVTLNITHFSGSLISKEFVLLLAGSSSWIAIDGTMAASEAAAGVDLQSVYNNDSGGNIILTSAKPLKIQAQTGDNDTLFQILTNDGTTTKHMEFKSTSSTDTRVSLINGISSANNSMAIGRSAQTTAAGSIVISDSSSAVTNSRTESCLMMFSNGIEFIKNDILRGTANNDPNYRIEFANVNTTDATTTTLFSYQLPSNTVIGIQANVMGIRTGGTFGVPADSCDFIIHAKSKYNGTNIFTDYSIISSSNDSTYVVIIDDNSTDTMRVRVTGNSNTNITWNAVVHLREFKYS